MSDEEGQIAEDLTAPDGPSGVLLHVSQTRIQVTWDSELEGDDDTGSTIEGIYAEEYMATSPVTETGVPATDAFDDGPFTYLVGVKQNTDEGDGEGIITDEEVAYFQVQLSDDALFANIRQFDRMVKGHSKTWRVSKPGTKLWYARVRSVDELGNKSDWVEDTRSNDVPTRPGSPSVRFIRGSSIDTLRAQVTVKDVTFDDEDISRYQFQIRELNFNTLTQDMTSGDATAHVSSYVNAEVPLNPPSDAPDFTVYIQSEELLVTSISGGSNLTWHVTRAQNGTTAAAHLQGKRVHWFGSDDKPVTSIVVRESNSTYTRQIFGGCPKNTRYKARVRALDAQNRKSEWSAWSPAIRAVLGAFVPAGTGDDNGPPEDAGDGDGSTPDDGTEDPTNNVGYPFERVFRLESDVFEGLVSDPFSGLEGTVTAARIELGDFDTAAVAASGTITVDINLNAVSFLTLTVTAGELMSDMTWVNPPLHIGQTTGQYFIATDELTVTQTEMSDTSGAITVYLYVYLTDGS